MTLPEDHYVVIGNPIAHSKSPYLHTQFALQCHQSMRYQTLLAPINGFEVAVRQFIEQNGKGASVTLPFKLEAFQLCDQLTARAQAASAVNTLLFQDQQIIGDNTDGVGLVTDITHNAGVTLTDQRVLLVGAGGAARGVLLPLLEKKPSEIVIANRTLSKAQQLTDQFSPFGQLSASSFEQLNGQFDIIINATSASISQELPPIPDSTYKPGTLAYDMMYATEPTLFMQQAGKQHAHVRDGWGMLVEQAAAAFYFWRGVRPDTRQFLTQPDINTSKNSSKKQST